MTFMNRQDIPDGYAQLSYLDIKHPVAIPGVAGPFDIVASITVPMGQYWIPKAVRVSLISAGVYAGVKSSTLPGAPPVAQLFLGAPQTEGAFVVATNPVINNNLGLYLDGTVRGDNDITGILSGMTLAPGNALTVVWHNVLPPIDINNNPVQGATAIMEVIGGFSNVPVEARETMLPETAGAPFRGKPGTSTPDNAYSISPFLVNSPGPGLTATLVSNMPPYLKLYALQWTWSGVEPTAAQTTGVFQIKQTNPGTTVTLTWDIAQTGPKLLPLNGLTIATPGVGTTQLQFFELAASGVAANALALTGTLVYTNTDAIQLP